MCLFLQYIVLKVIRFSEFAFEWNGRKKLRMLSYMTLFFPGIIDKYFEVVWVFQWRFWLFLGGFSVNKYCKILTFIYRGKSVVGQIVCLVGQR